MQTSDSITYRLTGDIKWPVDTPFSEALGICLNSCCRSWFHLLRQRIADKISAFPPGPLQGSFPILALRTNKADVAVGVSAKVAQELDDKGEKWRVSGKYVPLLPPFPERQ